MGWGRLWGPDPVVVGGLPDGDVVEVVVVVVVVVVGGGDTSPGTRGVRAEPSIWSGGSEPA